MTDPRELRSEDASHFQRRTPRQSVIVVLPEDHVFEPDSIAERITQDDEVEITIACAGKPSNLDALKRTARAARFLLAPSGMSPEDLRELAMEQTPGDIVTLLDPRLRSPWPRDRQALT